MRLASLLTALAIGAASTTIGCQTYRQDLDRAKAHYEQHQYEAALALFRVLEIDMDSFSTAEQTQYAYLRGMNDYRLASMVPAGTNVADARRGYRDNARHWLSVAQAIDKKTPGGLTDDEKGRLTEAMTDLNKDWYGGDDDAKKADAKPGDSASPSAKPAADDAKKPDAKP